MCTIFFASLVWAWRKRLQAKASSRGKVVLCGKQNTLFSIQKGNGLAASKAKVFLHWHPWKIVVVFLQVLDLMQYGKSILTVATHIWDDYKINPLFIRRSYSSCVTEKININKKYKFSFMGASRLTPSGGVIISPASMR